MKPTIKNQISELLSSEQEHEQSRAKLDVLRVLVVNRGLSWRSELIQDLGLLCAFKSEPEVGEGVVDKSLEELERDGLLKIEERVRGMMDGPREDELISLADPNATRSALSGDGVLTRYIHERTVGR